MWDARSRADDWGRRRIARARPTVERTSREYETSARGDITRVKEIDLVRITHQDARVRAAIARETHERRFGVLSARERRDLDLHANESSERAR